MLAHHLLDRDAVRLVADDAHELLAAAGHDVSPKAARAQVLQHLEHRLVDRLGVRPLEARVFGLGEPLPDDLEEFLRAYAGMGGGDDLRPVALSELRHRLVVAGEHRLERLLVLPLGVLRRERRQAVEREHRLGVERVLDPERAVVVEGGDAVGGRHIVGAAFGGHRLDERDDRLPGRPVIPRGQRVGLRKGGCGYEEAGNQRQQGAPYLPKVGSHRSLLAEIERSSRPEPRPADATSGWIRSITG
jgi:hypothetical protein